MSIRKSTRNSQKSDILNLQKIVRERLKSAIEAADNKAAKIEIDVLESLLKLNKFEDFSPPVLKPNEIKLRREKLINEIEARIQKLSK